jgi:hypothetical protein
MKVVDRKTFLGLPAGTFYCKGVQWAFQTICIKDDNSGENDWYEFNPAWINEDSTTCFDSLAEMLERGTSRPMQDTICRDGCFDEEAIFLIFERDDLLKLREKIDVAMALPITIDGCLVLTAISKS